MVKVQKPMSFLRILTCSRDPLRGLAWSRCKNSRFFAISAVLAQPSAGISVVEVQKPMVFLRFLRCPRNPLQESAWWRCKNLSHQALQRGPHAGPSFVSGGQQVFEFVRMMAPTRSTCAAPSWPTPAECWATWATTSSPRSR